MISLKYTAGDNPEEDDGEYGVCEGLEAKYDRMCSRKYLEASCVDTKRGNACQWVTKHVDVAADHSEKAAVFNMERVVAFGHDMVHNRGPIHVSPLDVVLLIAFIMTMFAVSLQLCQLYKQWKGRRGYHEIRAHEEDYDYEEGKKGFKVCTAAISS